jgi:7-cyano-7-deazaguanine synthase
MKTILIYSGGLDSTVLLYDLINNQGRQVRCLAIDYGQRHVREVEAGRTIARSLGVEHRTADLRALKPFLSGSSQTDPAIPVPHGHYTAESMKTTIVPNRNMLMLSVGIAWAIATKSEEVAYAAHAGDHAIYPDGRDEFASAMNTAALLADWHQVQVVRPFVRLSKADIVELGSRMKVPFEKTWSCYDGGPVHCGLCGTCVERREAFSLAGYPDPTEYVYTAKTIPV